MGFSIHEYIGTIISFLVFAWVMWKLAYKPVIEVLEKRRQDVENNLESAAKAREEAASMRRDYEARLAAAQKDAQEIIKKAEKVAEKNKDEIVLKAQKEADEMLLKAQRTIEIEKNRAIAELRHEVADLSVMVAGKVLGKSLTEEDHKRLAKEFVEEVGDVQ